MDSPTPAVGSAELLTALTVEQLLDAIAIRIDGPKAWAERLTIDWRCTDLDETHRATLGNGVLTHRLVGEDEPAADLTVVLTKPQLLGILMGAGLEGIATEGDTGVVGRLLAVVEAPDRNFAIVTP